MTKNAKLTPLQKAQIVMAEKRAAGTLEILNPIEKATRNPTSLRMAINGKCYDCGGQDQPNWRKRIKYCNIINCTLHPVRPYSKGVSTQECLDWQEAGTLSAEPYIQKKEKEIGNG